MNSGDIPAALAPWTKGCDSRPSGLGLFQVELLCLQAGLLLKESEPDDAEQAARTAIKLASAAECQFQWGAAKAGHLLGRSLLRQDRRDEARAILEKVRALRQRIGDPGSSRPRRCCATSASESSSICLSRR